VTESDPRWRGRRLGGLAGLVAAVGLVVTFGTACRGRESGAPVRIYLDSAPGTLDPHRHNELVIWSVLSNVYDALVRFDAAMRLEPALATSWEQVSPTQVRFRLRAGVTFHDGSPFTAADVVASFARARQVEVAGVRHHLEGIVSVVEEAPETLLVTTEGPAPTLLNRLAFLCVVPRAGAGPGEITEPVGTGPYRFAGHGPGGEVRLQAFPWWGGRPAVATAEFHTETADDVRAERLFRGEADVVRRFPEAQLAELDGLRLRSAVQPGMPVRILAVAPGAAAGDAARALADPRVRRALLLAVDRQALIDEAFGGNGIVASQYVHPVVFGFDPEISPLPYDPERARALLAQAGFPDGFEVELGHGQLAPEAVAPLVRGLTAVGIRVVERTLPFSELVQRAEEMPLLYYARTCTTGDASDFLGSLLHSRVEDGGYGAENRSGYAEPEVDALIEAADVELDPARRLVLLQRAQRRALADLPILPLAIRWSQTGLSSRIEVPTRHDEWLWVAGFSWRLEERAAEPDGWL